MGRCTAFQPSSLRSQEEAPLNLDANVHVQRFVRVEVLSEKKYTRNTFVNHHPISWLTDVAVLLNIEATFQPMEGGPAMYEFPVCHCPFSLVALMVGKC